MFNTASTANGPKISEFDETTFELSEVLQAFTTDSLSVNFNFFDIVSRISTDLSAQNPNVSEIIVGWIPLVSKAWHEFNNDPAITTTEVVPSPTSISCDFDKCTN